MTLTSRYVLPLLAAGQAQKEITHNEAIGRIDALLHLLIESRATMPPTTPTDGTAWIVATGATGDLAGEAGAIAVFDAGWSFVTPRDGCIAFVRDEGIFIHYAGGWRDGWPVPSLRVGGHPLLSGPIAGVAVPVGGSVVDSETRAVVAQLIAALAGLGLVTMG